MRKEGAALAVLELKSRSRGRPSSRPKLSASLEPFWLSSARLPATRKLKNSASAKVVKRGSCMVFSLVGGLSVGYVSVAFSWDCCSVSTGSRTRWKSSSRLCFIYSQPVRQQRAREIMQFLRFFNRLRAVSAVDHWAVTLRTRPSELPFLAGSELC